MQAKLAILRVTTTTKQPLKMNPNDDIEIHVHSSGKCWFCNL